MYYFAYGSNLSVTGMRVRCPAAFPIAKASLPDHRLVFRTWADVEPCPGHSVPGVLWTITSACETALDLYEDVAGGLYRRLTRSLYRDGVPEPVQALIYRMNQRGVRAAGTQTICPSSRKATADFGLDPRSLAEAERRARD